MGVGRVIVSREDHHAQFYAGGDWNHCLFVETLYVIPVICIDRPLTSW